MLETGWFVNILHTRTKRNELAEQWCGGIISLWIMHLDFYPTSTREMHENCPFSNTRDMTAVAENGRETEKPWYWRVCALLSVVFNAQQAQLEQPMMVASHHYTQGCIFHHRYFKKSVPEFMLKSANCSVVVSATSVHGIMLHTSERAVAGYRYLTSFYFS